MPRFWKAAAHLPADRFDAAAVLEFRAWLMAVRHDEAAEERELKALVDNDPGNAKALERLAVLMVQSGRREGSEASPPQGRDRPRPRRVPQDPVDGALTSRAGRPSWPSSPPC